MFGLKRIKNHEPSLYASRSDFCRLFQKDMNRLYLLSLMLTADATIAEQCFVGGLHIAQEANHVFKEWAESWARRAIIQNAIRVIRPLKATDGHSEPDAGSHNALTQHPEVAGVIDLPALERFVFVMSVLERYSDQECSLLLGCTRTDIAGARTRALDRMGRYADLQRKLARIDSNEKARDEKTRRDRSESAAGLMASGLVAPA